jgi:uridine kinase
MIIGIGGVSRAGKTTLAYKIREWLSQNDMILLHQDNFIQPLDKMPHVNDHIDWEHPGSLDFDALLKSISENKGIHKYVVVEGLMAFWNPKILALMDKKIYIRISKESFFSRKTIDKRWEKEPQWYLEHIWNSHFVYGLLPHGEANVLQLDGESCCIDEMTKQFLGINL